MLTLIRASKSRPSGTWRDDDYDVLADGKPVGRIMWTEAAPREQRWFWGSTQLPYRVGVDSGYEATREDAMQAFKKSWQRPRSTGNNETAFRVS